MAARKKSAKRSGGKKSGSAKRATAKKPSRKASPNRRTKSTKTTRSKKGSALSRAVRKRSKAGRGALNTVLQAGEKTWRTLKSTTAQVVEGVKETLGGESGGDMGR